MPSAVTPDEVRVWLAARIRELIAQRGTSIVRLAEQAGISRKHLGNVLAGRSSPTVDTVALLAGALGVTPASLLRAPRGRNAGAPGGGETGAPAE